MRIAETTKTRRVVHLRTLTGVHQALQSLSAQIHPFELETQQWRMATELPAALAPALEQLSSLAQSSELPLPPQSHKSQQAQPWLDLVFLA